MASVIEQDTAESPCINVCSMDAGNTYCLGCFRTLDEISLWSEVSNDQRQAILVAAKRRREELTP